MFERIHRVYWVSSQLIFLMVLPSLTPFLVAALILPGQAGIWVLGFGVAVGILLTVVITGFMMVALFSPRFYLGSLWSGLEKRVHRIVQLEPPVTGPNEEILYSTWRRARLSSRTEVACC
jgi:hypothetical protein